ncbi:MAG TPA: ABC transporter permease [Candidatus Polarisedimenticolia bacterium]|nr:ABC transporter permease [Candidatus Polarisedimenticolia bacterium]
MPDWREAVRQRLERSRLDPSRRAAVVEELAQHLEDRCADLLAAGASPAEAERRTRAELDESTGRDETVGTPAAPLERIGRGNGIADLGRDLAQAARRLRGNVGFAAVVVITLALGTGANAAVFSIVDAVLLRQLPFREPDRLVSVAARHADRGRYPFNLPDFLDYRDRNRTLAGLAAYGSWSINLTGTGDPERLSGLRVSAGLFDLLGTRPIAGRALLPADDEPGHQRVVVLTHALWQRRFGGDPGIVGRSILLNGAGYEVVGVLPPQFLFPIREAELAAPLAPQADASRAVRTSTNALFAIGRLRPGVTLEQAETDIDAVARRLREEYPEANAHKAGAMVTPLRDELVSGFRQALWVLFGAVGVVLLIASVNLASLSLARASSRHREMAVRAALGASRGRLVRQLGAESLLLSLLGGAAGVLLAGFGVDLLVALSPASLPRLVEVHLDRRVLLFTLAIALLSGMVFGLGPALWGSRPDLQEMLRSRRGDGAGPARRRGRSVLVVAEIALSLVLLAGAGLLVKSFVRLQRVDPGFRADHLLVLRLSLPKDRYHGRVATAAFCDTLRPRLVALPGVEAAGVVSALPLSGTLAAVPFTIDGRAAPPDEHLQVHYRLADAGSFRALGVPLVAGRMFDAHDGPDAPPVALVSRGLARRFWPEADPIGATLHIDDNDSGPRPVTIVGIVGDVRHLGLDSDPEPHLYIPVSQAHEDSVGLLTGNQYWLLRTSVAPQSLVRAARQAVASADAGVPATNIRTMEQYLEASVAPRRFNLRLLLAFAAASLLLAATGLYGVISYGVAQRTHEIGVRMTLGALRRDVLRLVVGQGMALAAAGVGLGLVASLLLTRVASSLLFGVSATDPATFAGIAVLVLGVALLACLLPARRATRVDPIVALRSE